MSSFFDNLNKRVNDLVKRTEIFATLNEKCKKVFKNINRKVEDMDKYISRKVENTIYGEPSISKRLDRAFDDLSTKLDRGLENVFTR